MDASDWFCLAVNLITLAYCGWHGFNAKGCIE